MSEATAPLSRWSDARLSAKVSDIVLSRPWRWPGIGGFLLTFAGSLAFLGAIIYLFLTGVGIWGINIPVAWGFAIANYVWWVGIGMAGTFISAALLLTRQRWRASINRTAEAMTVFAVSIAGIFPIFHLGRPWFFYWLAPYPNVMELWPQWRSALVWDFFAIGTYLVVSLVFWYAGLLPDLATLRDRAKRRGAQLFYGLLALGWRGEARHWARQESLMRLLAGLAVPLVFSVHSMVAMDFAIAIEPGYHSTLFPPYFVAGALFSGFATMLVLAIPMRRIFGLEELITTKHLENMAKLLLASGWIVAYGYFSEHFFAYYGGDRYEIAMVENRMFGYYAPLYWTLLFCNVVLPQLFWLRAARRSPPVLFGVGVAVIVGMWIERVVIVVQSMHRDFLPSAWGLFIPTAWDWVFLGASILFFGFLFLLFVRLLPAISMADMRKLRHEMNAIEGVRS